MNENATARYCAVLYFSGMTVENELSWKSIALLHKITVE